MIRWRHGRNRQIEPAAPTPAGITFTGHPAGQNTTPQSPSPAPELGPPVATLTLHHNLPASDRVRLAHAIQNALHGVLLRHPTDRPDEQCWTLHQLTKTT